MSGMTQVLIDSESSKTSKVFIFRIDTIIAYLYNEWKALLK